MKIPCPHCNKLNQLAIERLASQPICGACKKDLLSAPLEVDEKLFGELTDDTNLTIRTSHIGRELSVKKSLVEWLLSQRNGQVSGFSGAIYSGLTTTELAKIIGNLLLSASPLTGMFHVSSEAISKLEIIDQLNELLELKIKVVEDKTVQINRSLNSSLFQSVANTIAPKWNQMLKEFCADQAAYD